MNPYQVTRDLEAALAEYTGAKHVVCVNSCTAALLLAVKHCSGVELVPRTGSFGEPIGSHLGGTWEENLISRPRTVTIPRRTYVSVPASIVLAGARVAWRDENWRGAYQLKPLLVWDCARRFTSGMYVAGQFQCVSFSSSKILGIEQGGAILHDSDEADPWFRRMRFDGRTEGVATVDDNFREIGLHCIMLPSIAAQLLLKLSFLPKHNEDLPMIEYPDLSKFECFK